MKRVLSEPSTLGELNSEWVESDDGIYYLANDVDREMIEMIEKLANLVTGAPPAIQT